MDLYQGLSVASPAHQEAPASALLAGLEALVSEVYSLASTLDKGYTEAVSDQVVLLEATASAWEVEL